MAAENSEDDGPEFTEDGNGKDGLKTKARTARMSAPGKMNWTTVKMKAPVKFQATFPTKTPTTIPRETQARAQQRTLKRS